MLGALQIGLASAAFAQADEQIIVTAKPVLVGAGLAASDVPAQTASLGPRAIAAHGSPNLTAALADTVPGFSVGDAAGNPFQPNISYHGYAASPTQGVAQGLAVYQDGVRINQAFGDTLDWDLIPPLAIAQADLAGANPVFGLNALGGALNVRSKTGFGAARTALDLTAGSFATFDAQGEIARQFGDSALYAAGRIAHQDGWRDGQHSDIKTIFLDLGHRVNDTEFHLRLNAADNDLNGPGPTPVQLLAVDRQAAFTIPNVTHNSALGANVSATTPLSGSLDWQAIGYWRYLNSAINNGNAPNDTPCADNPALLCAENGAQSTGRDGAIIPAFWGAGPYSELDKTTTNSNAFGASSQITWRGLLANRPNVLVGGAAIDAAQTLFSATPLIGGLNLQTRDWVGPGIVLNEPGQTAPARVAVGSQVLGVYITDTWRPFEKLGLTASARLNDAQIDLRDLNGGAVSGTHHYTKLNPAVGATYALATGITAYSGFAQTNRAPTPAELSCASPAAPCTLANFFVADPNLRQVVAHTLEAGVRTSWRGATDFTVHADVGVFHTIADNDITYINSARLGRAYFANIGQTRRQGIDARLTAVRGPLSLALGWALIDATTRAGYSEAAGNNPAAFGDTITVRPGARLPGIPQNRVTLGVDWRATPALTLGWDASFETGRVLFGDEANLTPRLSRFTVVNATASWAMRAGVTLVARLENLANAHYASFGIFAPTAAVPIIQVPGASDPRSLSPAAPRAAYLTVNFAL